MTDRYGTSLANTIVTTQPAAPSSEVQTVKVELAAPLTALKLQGVVRDVQGNALSRATVVFSDASSYWRQELATVVTDEAGGYELLLVTDGFEAAEWSLDISLSHGATTVNFYKEVSATAASTLNEITLNFVSDPNAPGTSKWSFKSGHENVNAPALGFDGTVYITAYSYGDFSDGELVALTANGDVAWKFVADPDLYLSYPVIGPEGTIYFTGSKSSWQENNRGVLYAVAPDGGLVWQLEYKTVLKGLVVGSDGVLYLLDEKTTLRAIAPDGVVRWTHIVDPVESQWWYGLPSIGPDGTLYIPLYNSLHAISSQGQPLWKAEAEDPIAFGTDGSVLVNIGGYYGNAASLDSADGSVLRIYELNNSSLKGISVGPDGRVYAVAGYEGAGLDVFGADGELLWSHDIVYAAADWPAVLGEDGTLYILAYRTGLTALDANGVLQWKFEESDDGGASPVLASDGTLYASSYDGTLYAIRTSSRGLAASPWPVFQGDNQNSGRAGR